MDTRALVDIVIISIFSFMSIVALGITINRAALLYSVDITKYESLDDLERSLTRYMHLLASIGANSPYIGLLGTVVGIMATFSALSVDGGDVSGVMKGLSSALFATGLGLVVAIPSVFLYNVLLRGIKNKLTEWKIGHGRERI